MSSRLARDVALAVELLSAFAERQRRYLWTDAFATSTWLGLARSGEQGARARAEQLIAAVHDTLGRTRDGSPLAGEDAAEHPTRGGLRIGKSLPDRGADEPYDAEREWDRDGQYFHYLTKWMCALDQAARAFGDARIARWSRELAEVACRAFRRTGADGRSRLVWKLSVDLRRTMVPAMGQHDALDGMLTCAQLRATQRRLGETPGLGLELSALAVMSGPADWATEDALGLGGLLTDACRAIQLSGDGPVDWPLVGALLRLSYEGIARLHARGSLRRDPRQRLAFRELGLAIGLEALPIIEPRVPEALRPAVSALQPLRAIGETIVATWREPGLRSQGSWCEHQDINDVMLAAALAPEGVLVLA